MAKYKFFWSGVFSNWYPAFFVVDGVTYNCGEQWMMAQKAILFNDEETLNKIMSVSSPKIQKELGRTVKNFNDKYWYSRCNELVKIGLKEKFKQNFEMKEQLLKYKGYIFVEASPRDRIWGIGFDEKHALSNIYVWGENRLGKILTELSNEL